MSALRFLLSLTALVMLVALSRPRKRKPRTRTRSWASGKPPTSSKVNPTGMDNGVHQGRQVQGKTRNKNVIEGTCVVDEDTVKTGAQAAEPGVRKCAPGNDSNHVGYCLSGKSGSLRPPDDETQRQAE